MSYTDILMQAQRNMASTDNGKSHRNGSHQNSGKKVNQAAVQRLLKEKEEKKLKKELEERRMRKEASEKLREKQKKQNGRPPVNNGDRSSAGGKNRVREDGGVTEEQDRKHKEFMKNISKSSSGKHRSSHHNHNDSRPQKSLRVDDVERKKKKKIQQAKPVASFDQLLKLAEKQNDLSDEEPSPDRSSSKHGGTKRKATATSGSGVFSSSSFKIAKIQRSGDDNRNEEEMKRKKAKALAARFASNKSSSSPSTSSSAGRQSTMTSSKSSRMANGKSSSLSGKNGGRQMHHRNGVNNNRPPPPPKKPTSNICLKPVKRENGIIDICDGLVVPKSNPNNKPSKDRSKKPVVKKTEFSLNPYKKAELEKRKLAAKGGGVGGTVGGAVGGSGSTTKPSPATPITEKKQKVKSSSGQQHTSSSGGNSKCTLRVQSTGVRTNYPGVSSTDPNRYQQQRIQQYGVSPPPYGKPPASKRDEYHQRAMKAAMARGRNGRHLTKKASRLLDSDEEDYDPEMDDFIDDEEDSAGVNISNEISKIFKYDRTRYDTAQEEYECSRMDVGFHEIEREEQRSTRIARREDAEAAREEEKQRRSELERKRKRQL